MHQFCKATLREALGKLPVPAQSAFAQACAIRTLRTTRGEMPQVVEALCLRTLDVAEMAAAGDEASLALCVDLGAELESIDIDDERHSACAYVLRHLVSKGDIENVIWAAEVAYNLQDQVAVDALDFKTFTPEIEKAILASQSVQLELHSQDEDLQQLLFRPSGWKSVIERARGGAR